jgi:hypothetical protein
VAAAFADLVRSTLEERLSQLGVGARPLTAAEAREAFGARADADALHYHVELAGSACTYSVWIVPGTADQAPPRVLAEERRGAHDALAVGHNVLLPQSILWTQVACADDLSGSDREVVQAAEERFAQGVFGREQTRRLSQQGADADG